MKGNLGDNLIKSKIILSSEKEIGDFYNLDEEALRALEDKFEVKISARGNLIYLSGKRSSAKEAKKYLKKYLEEQRKNKSFPRKRKAPDLTLPVNNEALFVTTRGKKIMPQTPGQVEYVKAISNYDMVFGIGPAGTGKTYLAVAMAIFYLRSQKVSRIILTRPAIEAGEKLGFLPGDVQAKIDPYFRPIYDALFDMMEVEKFQNYLERGIIEIAPLAFMRGRTLNDAFIILDEAQNTTLEQMKMFLTRLGFSSRAVITGDITQIDLPNDSSSGLIEAKNILSDIPEIKIVYFGEEDVVRHELVQKIVRAYENGVRKK